jgi:hypothetical protein
MGLDDVEMEAESRYNCKKYLLNQVKVLVLGPHTRGQCSGFRDTFSHLEGSNVCVSERKTRDLATEHCRLTNALSPETSSRISWLVLRDEKRFVEDGDGYEETPARQTIPPFPSSQSL